MKPGELRAWRADLGMNQTEMASYLGLASRRTIQRWEGGHWPIPRLVELVWRLSGNREKATTTWRTER